MTTSHDDQWIQAQLTDGPGWHYMDYHVEMVAKGYFEHMMRWRELDEMPEEGQRIEVLYRCEADWVDDWTSIRVFHLNFNREIGNGYLAQGQVVIPYKWRPAGELPE